MIIIDQNQRARAYHVLDQIFETFFFPAMLPHDVAQCKIHIAGMKAEKGVFYHQGTLSTDPATKVTRIILEFSHDKPLGRQG